MELHLFDHLNLPFLVVHVKKFTRPKYSPDTFGGLYYGPWIFQGLYKRSRYVFVTVRLNLWSYQKCVFHAWFMLIEICNGEKNLMVVIFFSEDLLGLGYRKQIISFYA